MWLFHKNHCCRGHTTMRSVCIVEPPVTEKYINISGVAQQCFYGKFLSPTTMKSTSVLMWSARRFAGTTESCWYQNFALFWMLFAFVWVIPRRLNFICRRFGTLCSVFIGLWRWNIQIVPKRLHMKFRPRNCPQESVQRGKAHLLVAYISRTLQLNRQYWR